jgi:hypothetical protein
MLYELVKVVGGERAADPGQGRGRVPADRLAGINDEFIQPSPSRVAENLQQSQVAQIGSSAVLHVTVLTLMSFS